MPQPIRPESFLSGPASVNVVSEVGTGFVRAGGHRFGRFLLVQRIGLGGMAEVWKAKLHGANEFSKWVVVKRILPHLSGNVEFAQMFTTEARLCARLSHPNIV